MRGSGRTRGAAALRVGREHRYAEIEVVRAWRSIRVRRLELAPIPLSRPRRLGDDEGARQDVPLIWAGSRGASRAPATRATLLDPASTLLLAAERSDFEARRRRLERHCGETLLSLPLRARRGHESALLVRRSAAAALDRGERGVPIECAVARLARAVSSIPLPSQIGVHWQHEQLRVSVAHCRRRGVMAPRPGLRWFLLGAADTAAGHSLAAKRPRSQQPLPLPLAEVSTVEWLALGAALACDEPGSLPLRAPSFGARLCRWAPLASCWLLLLLVLLSWVVAEVRVRGLRAELRVERARLERTLWEASSSLAQPPSGEGVGGPR